MIAYLQQFILCSWLRFFIISDVLLLSFEAIQQRIDSKIFTINVLENFLSRDSLKDQKTQNWISRLLKVCIKFLNDKTYRDANPKQRKCNNQNRTISDVFTVCFGYKYKVSKSDRIVDVFR